MSLPPTIIPVKPRVRRKRRQAPSPPSPPAALTLVAATYDQSGPTLTLVFDRAVNVTAFDGTAVDVEDQLNGWSLVGVAAILLDPVTVQIPLDQIGSSSGPDILLSATALSGIVAVDDGGTWGGITDLELPFP